MPREHINPPELFPSLQYGFSQIISCTGGRTVYISGQVAWDERQQIIGADDLLAQTRQTIQNIKVAMQAAGGSLSDVVSMRIYIVESKLDEGHHIREALQEFFPEDRAPTTTWVGVRSLANKEFLVEIEAIAVIE